MDNFIATADYINDLSATRLHHEIYLSDPRKTAAEKLKTVIRHPVKKKMKKSFNRTQLCSFVFD